MSRFNNPKVLETLKPPAASGQHLASAIAFPPEPHSPPIPATSLPLGQSPEPTIVQQICFVLVCLFMLSLYVNDISFIVFHGKAYISTVCLFLVPVAYLATGTPFRGLRNRIGIYWLAFGIWLILAAPFSAWKGGTFSVLINYFPRSFMMLFFVAACTVSIRQCRKFLYVLILCAFVVLFTCFQFGGFKHERFSIVESVFFSNSNELALQLAMGIAYMTFFFFTRSKLLKLLGCVGIALSLSFIMKTASRGTFLATAVMAVVIFVYSRYKIPLLVGGLVLLIVAFIMLPAATRDRLLFIKMDSASAQADNEEELSALESQQQREHLLRMSLAFTLTHPIFGVGPGEFVVAAVGDAEKEGKNGDWVGTHNSYTQVSSEAGLPAFFFYTAALFLCLRANFRRFRKASAAKLRELAGLSFSLFLASFVYAVATIFFHIAYASYLPVILGLTIALELAAKPMLERQSA